MVQEIIRILGQSSAGVTLQEIARAVKGGDPIAIQQSLEGLQKKKLVRIDKVGGRWTLIGARAPADHMSGPVSKSRRTKAITSLRGIEAVGLVASRFRIKPRPIAQTSETKFDSQALLRYYHDCLAAEERSDSSASMDEAGERFLPVRLEGAWWPTATELPRFTIATQLLPATFQQAMGRSKSDAVIHLGYPLEVFAASDDGLMVRAIASVPLRWKAIGDGLVELSPIDTSLSVNPNWISYHLKNFDFFALLRRLGADNSDEDTEALTSDLGELPELCAALNLAFAQKRLADLDPTKTASALLRDIGIQNAAALFVVADARFSAGAIRDLTELSKKEIAEFRGTALGTVLGLEMPTVINSPSVVEPLDLTFSQLTAVRSGLSHALSVITGPPGTGKSQVVAAILASAALAGKTVLFASRNHAALDAVEERLRELSPERPLLLRLNQRWGQGQPVRLQTLISQLVSRPGGLGDRQPLESRVATLGGLDHERSKLTERAIEIARKRELVGALEDELERHLTLLAFDLSRALTLPAPKGRAPADAGKLSKVSEYLRRLIARVARQRPLMRAEWHQAGCPDPALDAEAFDRWTAALSGAQTVSASIRAAVETLPAESEQVSMGKRIEEVSKRIRSGSPSLLLDLARLLDTCPDQQRSRLIELRGQSDKRRLSAETIRLLLPHYPLWACSNLTISRFVGLDLGLFDYVVIDEASQCDIASAIPLLARAKQAVIVGDPAQLSMISRLSPEWEAETLSNLKLSDAPGIGRFMQSRNSLFDLASTVAGAMRHLLTDHFRCQSEIADYVAGFYGGALSVATDESRLRAPPGSRLGLAWEDVTGPIVSASGGGCHAPAEAEAILASVEELLIKQDYQGTLGVCTPFREQARRITDLIANRIPSGLVDRAKLVAQTANGFQGDARDVMLVSLCLGSDTPFGSLAFVREGGNLMNVAISRAKAVCRVYGDKAFALGCGIPHITRLAKACDKSGRATPDQRRFESPWEERLFDVLRASGIECVPQFPVAGRRLDLAWFGRDGNKLDIEVDGDRYHRDASGLRKIDDLWRDHQLRGLGWKVLRFWVYELRENMNGAVERVREAANSSA